MKYVLMLGLACLTLATSTSHGKETQPELVHNLGTRIKDRTYTAIEQAYTLRIPRLGAEEKIQISDVNAQPGITSFVSLIGDNGTVAGVVTTKIRPDYPQDDSLLDKVKPRYQRLYAPDEGFSFFDTADAKGDEVDDLPRYFQFTLANERYEQVAFPFGIATQSNEKLESMGIHRFFVRNGYFYEAIVIFPTGDGDSMETAVKKAEGHMTELLDGLTPIEKVEKSTK